MLTVSRRLMVSANQSHCSGLQLGVGKDQGRLSQAIHNALALAFPDYMTTLWATVIILQNRHITLTVMICV
jgi:hypothetical protein